MSTEQGTLDLIAVELADLFHPLFTRLQAGNAQVLFAQLGYVVSEAQESAIANSLQAVAVTTEELLGLASEITDAVEAEDYGKLTQKVIQAGAKTRQLIDAFPDLQAALSGQGVAGDLGKFSERLFGYLVSDYFYRKQGFGTAFELLGVVERTDFNVASEDPDNPPYTVSELFLDRLFRWLGDPVQELKDQFDWGEDGFDGTKLLPRLAKAIASTGLPAVYLPENVPPVLDMVFLEAYADTSVDPNGLFIGLASDLSLENMTVSDEDWEAVFSFEFSIPQNAGLIIQPGGQITVTLPDTSTESISGQAGVQVTVARRTIPSPFVLVGQPGGSRVEFLKAGLEFGTRLIWNAEDKEAAGEFVVAGSLTEGKIVIDASQGDGFLQNIMPGSGMEASFDMRTGYSSETGFFFEGSSTLEIKLPLHVSIGPIHFEAITIGLGIRPDEFPVSLGGDIRAELGPLVAVVENMGITARFTFPDGGGNLGPLNGSIDFKPPTGVGLSIDAGVVKGGGFLRFDFERDEYAGALELTFSDFLSLKAIGLITTRMPDGSTGFSLLIIISAEFTVQLGYGFVFLGAGGLLGLHRTMKLEPLAEGIRTGATANIMFPTNIVENAPQIISDLRIFFPPEEDKFLIGPMIKIGWGTPTLISIALGIIIEIRTSGGGAIERIAIVGVLKCILPEEEAPILVLQVNFIGAIDFQKKTAFFFASIFESRVLFITIEGEMGLLIAWGEDANFLVSVGGFHPRFNPPPLPFPVPRRLAFNILNESWGKIRVEGYFAVTSNTVQLGAKAELFFGFSALSVEGHLSFDALFQFDPFFFILDISMKVSLKVFGLGLFSISLKFTLEGPTPYRAKGYGKISFFFFSIKVNFDFTWGENRDTTLEPIPVLPILKKEFEKVQNWQALVPASNQRLVSLRELPQAADTEADLVLHPLGTLRISQRAVPINIKIDKVGNQRPSDAQLFKITDITGTFQKIGDFKESFARAQFQDMEDSQKLSSPAFEKEPGGVELSVSGKQIQSARMTVRHVRFELITIDTAFKRFQKRFFSWFSVLFGHFLNYNAAAQSALSLKNEKERQPFAEKIELLPNAYTVAFNKDNTPFTAEATHFESISQAETFLATEIAGDPQMESALHIIPNDEVNFAE